MCNCAVRVRIYGRLATTAELMKRQASRGAKAGPKAKVELQSKVTCKDSSGICIRMAVKSGLAVPVM